MEENQILDSDVLNTASNVEPQYIISQSKFITLCALTMGLYGVWWVYKSWRFFREYEDSDIMPAVRAFFAIIFLIPLLNKIQDFAKDSGYTSSFSSGALFAGFLITNLLSRLPDPMWLVSIFSFVFLIPAFNALNYAKLNTPDLNVIEQESFNGKQIILLIIGGLFTAFLFYILITEPSGGY